MKRLWFRLWHGVFGCGSQPAWATRDPLVAGLFAEYRWACPRCQRIHEFR